MRGCYEKGNTPSIGTEMELHGIGVGRYSGAGVIFDGCATVAAAFDFGTDSA